jgi:hypothetical protein
MSWYDEGRHDRMDGLRPRPPKGDAEAKASYRNGWRSAAKSGTSKGVRAQERAMETAARKRRLIERSKRSNPAKRVVLKNFTGTITKNKNGTVSIKGRKK